MEYSLENARSFNVILRLVIWWLFNRVVKFLQVEEIGSIEGGISAAKWSPDFTRLVIMTNNNTILCMSTDWEVLYEVPVIENRVFLSQSDICWRGDGESFSLLSVDETSNTDTSGYPNTIRHRVILAVLLQQACLFWECIAKTWSY